MIDAQSWPNLTKAQRFIDEYRPRSDLHTSVILARAFDKGVSVHVNEDRRIELSHGRNRYRLSYSRTNYNHKLAIQCTRQKEITSRLLRSSGIACPENAVFAPPDVHRAWQWARVMLPVVVKPVDSQSSAGVRTGLSDEEAFKSAFSDIADDYGTVLVEKQMHGAEYRIIVIKGEYIAACRRVPPNVTGNGASTIASLIDAKNRVRASSGNLVHEAPIVIDEALQTYLGNRSLGLDTVPDSRRKVLLRATPGSVSSGGDRIDETDTLSDTYIKLALRAVKQIQGLRVAGVDLILPCRKSDDPACVLEINDHPGFAMHYFPWKGTPRDPAGRMLDAMFEGLQG